MCNWVIDMSIDYCSLTGSGSRYLELVNAFLSSNSFCAPGFNHATSLSSIVFTREPPPSFLFHQCYVYVRPSWSVQAPSHHHDRRSLWKCAMLGRHYVQCGTVIGLLLGVPRSWLLRIQCGLVSIWIIYGGWWGVCGRWRYSGVDGTTRGHILDCYPTHSRHSDSPLSIPHLVVHFFLQPHFPRFVSNHTSILDNIFPVNGLFLPRRTILSSVWGGR